MSYDISFKVKVDGIDKYVDVGNCSANTTWNVGQMIRKATGLPWKNCENNGRCVEIIPHIEKGFYELMLHPEKYKKYEAKNGWGTVETTKEFFARILKDWESFCEWEDESLISATTFWIE